MKKDIAASVRARLLALAKSQGADFNQVRCGSLWSASCTD